MLTRNSILVLFPPCHFTAWRVEIRHLTPIMSRVIPLSLSLNRCIAQLCLASFAVSRLTRDCSDTQHWSTGAGLLFNCLLFTPAESLLSLDSLNSLVAGRYLMPSRWSHMLTSFHIPPYPLELLAARSEGDILRWCQQYAAAPEEDHHHHSSQPVRGLG